MEQDEQSRVEHSLIYYYLFFLWYPVDNTEIFSQEEHTENSIHPPKMLCTVQNKCDGGQEQNVSKHFKKIKRCNKDKIASHTDITGY